MYKNKTKQKVIFIVKVIYLTNSQLFTLGIKKLHDQLDALVISAEFIQRATQS